MIFLIFGGRGWIGQQFIEYMQQKNISFHLSSFRVNGLDTEKIKNEIIEKKITHVLCSIGRTHGVTETNEKIGTIDYLEGRLRENLADNLYAPLELLATCKDTHTHLTYMGTGCIFEYDSLHPPGGAPFTEEDFPNFFGSGYSTVKGFTDRLMRFEPNHVLNVRIRMPISSQINERNFITKITSYEKICSLPNSMTVLDELIPFIIQLASQNHTGTINMTNPGVITHNEILEMYKEIVDPSFTWKNFTIQEQEKILLSKRSNNFLCTKKLESLVPVKDIKTSVRDVLLKMKKNM